MERETLPRAADEPLTPASIILHIVRRPKSAIP
jgi:hypothetical protein